MEKLKEALMYLAVFAISLTFVFAFMDTFAFEDEEDTIEALDVTIDDIYKLYSYIPQEYNDYGISSMYTAVYTKYSNLSSTMIGMMVYNYILEYNSEFLEEASPDEIEITQGEILNKISHDNFYNILHIIFGSEVEYGFKDFNISYTLKAKYENNYYYIIKKDNTSTTTNTNTKKIFKEYVSYTVEDEGQTVKIYEYYLYCDTETNMCYNDEKEKKLNSNIIYSEDLNILDYTDYLQEYVHTFKYENGNYYWYSSEDV